MEKKCRLRAPNFTMNDSLLLCDIVGKHKNIIENKKTDGANLAQRQEAWIRVGHEFNALTTGYHRTVESLQQNYKNLKKKAKKHVSGAKMEIPVDRSALIQNIEAYGTSSEGWQKVAESTGSSEAVCQEVFMTLTKEVENKDKAIKKNIMGTGGGPPLKSDDDPLLDKVKGLVGSSIDGLYTIYDGDSSIMELQNIPPIEKNLFNNEDRPILQTPKKIEFVDTDGQPYVSVPETSKAQSQEDQSLYFTNNRANLKRKPHDLLTRKRKLDSQEAPEKQTVGEKFKALASQKMECVLIQKELLQLEVVDAKEKLEHNRLLRAMELEDAKLKYEHIKNIRKLELEKIYDK